MRLTVVLLLFVVAACGREEPASESAAWTYIDTPGGAGVHLELNGVRVEFETPMQYRYRSETDAAGVARVTRTLNGHDFGIRDGVFFIGDVEYGGVTRGDKIVIDPKGVHVNGERRGEAPASVDGG